MARSCLIGSQRPEALASVLERTLSGPGSERPEVHAPSGDVGWVETRFIAARPTEKLRRLARIVAQVLLLARTRSRQAVTMHAHAVQGDFEVEGRDPAGPDAVFPRRHPPIGSPMTRESSEIATGTQPQVFVSYARSDAEQVLEIARLLEEEGATVWRDGDRILGGQYYGEEIVHAIAHSRVVMLMCSPHSFQSDNVHREVLLTWEYYHRRYIPVWLCPATDIPERFRYCLAGCQWIDAHSQPPERWLPQLLKALEALGVETKDAGGASRAKSTPDRRSGRRDRPARACGSSPATGRSGARLGAGATPGQGRLRRGLEGPQPRLARPAAGGLEVLPATGRPLQGPAPARGQHGPAGPAADPLRRDRAAAARLSEQRSPLPGISLHRGRHAGAADRRVPPVGRLAHAGPGPADRPAGRPDRQPGPSGDAQLVHRDLKPSNILVERRADGKIVLRVTDFGIGGLAAQPVLERSRSSSSLQGNMASVLTGSYSPLYASPQQMRGDKPDPRDDVYALGVIWYQLLTGDLTSPAPTGRRWVDELRRRGMSDAAIDLLSSCFESDPAAPPRRRRRAGRAARGD